MKFTLLAAAIMIAGGVYAAVNVAATNNLPDPYHPVENWAQLPAGVQWGQVIGVQPDAPRQPLGIPSQRSGDHGVRCVRQVSERLRQRNVCAGARDDTRSRRQYLGYRRIREKTAKGSRFSNSVRMEKS